MKKLFVQIASVLALSFLSATAHADSATEIKANVEATMKKFEASLDSSDKLLDKAAGVLVFPEVFKGGFVFGAEYGEGALLVSDGLRDYYSLTSASVGLQAGAQKKSVVILFMTEQSLNEFLAADGWEAGADASIALITLGEQESVNTITNKKPVLAFVLDQKGLMANVTVEGSKITRIDR